MILAMIALVAAGGLAVLSFWSPKPAAIWALSFAMFAGTATYLLSTGAAHRGYAYRSAPIVSALPAPAPLSLG